MRNFTVRVLSQERTLVKPRRRWWVRVLTQWTREINSALNILNNILNYFCCCLSDPCRMGEKIVIDVTGHGGIRPDFLFLHAFFCIKWRIRSSVCCRFKFFEAKMCLNASRGFVKILFFPVKCLVTNLQSIYGNFMEDYSWYSSLNNYNLHMFITKNKEKQSIRPFMHISITKI